jgi:hypothetical protein
MAFFLANGFRATEAVRLVVREEELVECRRAKLREGEGMHRWDPFSG